MGDQGFVDRRDLVEVHATQEASNRRSKSKGKSDLLQVQRLISSKLKSA